jgi:hypothetical protein
MAARLPVIAARANDTAAPAAKSGGKKKKAAP